MNSDFKQNQMVLSYSLQQSSTVYQINMFYIGHFTYKILSLKNKKVKTQATTNYYCYYKNNNNIQVTAK